ncbi:MAG: LysE family transporter [Spirochaetes bacterium]|uniref:LysE family transporter n=1 Tax=Candidatus Ornithospirochaeta stercoripullorum TaxID=2840899 RepID=A0A9D9DZZ8_9SPIO|nr:LysE family transporter [Candidatus Ornithospirochaeta stercoripullorum]
MATLLVYIITMSITPGPNTILSMANAATVGFKRGIRLNVGMLAGITVDTIIALLAVELFYSFLPKAQLILQAAAVIYLVYLAIKMLKLGFKETENRSATFIEGLLLQLINIKVYILAFTAISAYIIPFSSSDIETIVLSLLVPVICFVSGLIWAIGGTIMKSLFIKHRKLMAVLFFLALFWCALQLALPLLKHSP